MDYIWDGFIKAIELSINFDKEIYGIIGLSLFVSTSATLIASLIFVPLSCYFGIKEFNHKRHFSRLVYTFMSILSVIVGLVVVLLFTRNGPLGFLGIMYTPKAMILAQSLLVVPLMFGLTYNLGKHRGMEYKKSRQDIRWRGFSLHHSYNQRIKFRDNSEYSYSLFKGNL
jgi:tungstate transport system permease protein